MLDKRALIVLCAVLGCFVLVGTSLAVTSMRSWWVKQNMKTYIDRLEEGGFTIQMQPFNQGQIRTTCICYSIETFQEGAEKNHVTVIFFDSDRAILYYLTTSSDGALQATVLSCNFALIS